MRMIPVLVLLFVSFGVTAVAEVDPGTPMEERVAEHLAEGVKLYRLGQYKDAAIALRTALEVDPTGNNPTNKQCFDFYLYLGKLQYMNMMERAELEGVMKDLLRRARIYETRLRHDPRYIAHLIGKLRDTEENRLVAKAELVAIGPIAVPQLVENLVGENRKEDLRVYCRVTLTEMGHRAVMPLIECLKSEDQRIVKSAAASLTDIGDPRALPYLQALIENPETDEIIKRVSSNAVEGIAHQAGLPEVSGGAQLFYEESLRYFRDSSRVRSEGRAAEHLIWRWREDEDGTAKLTYTVVPSYAWNELVAEQMLIDGETDYPAYDGYYSLHAAVLEAQYVEAARRLRLMKERTVPSDDPADSVTAIQERIDALSRGDDINPEIEDRVVAVGATNLYRALKQSIVSERYLVANRLMEHLSDPWLSQAEKMLPTKDEGLMAGKEGTVLVAALDHPSKTIRYQAAVTLALLDPQVEFFNAEKVVPVLEQAVGEWGMRVVLVIEPDYRERNAARHALEERGYLAITASDGFDAMDKLKQAPVKDCIIVSGTLSPTLTDEFDQLIDVPLQHVVGVVSELSKRPNTAETPIFLSLPENKKVANEWKTKVEKDLNELKLEVDGWVDKPFNGVELARKIDSAIGDADLPVLNAQIREEMSLAAAEALGDIDPIRSQFPLRNAGDALVKNVVNRSDAIKAASLRALGLTGRDDLIGKVTDGYVESKELIADKPEVRSAFVYCIGMLDPTTEAAVAILKEAVSDPDREVRRQAFLALGRAEDLPNKTLADVESDKRLDVLNPGAGSDAAIARPAVVDDEAAATPE